MLQLQQNIKNDSNLGLGHTVHCEGFQDIPGLWGLQLSGLDIAAPAFWGLGVNASLGTRMASLYSCILCYTTLLSMCRPFSAQRRDALDEGGPVL